jgi:hypothetical protein
VGRKQEDYRRAGTGRASRRAGNLAAKDIKLLKVAKTDMAQLGYSGDGFASDRRRLRRMPVCPGKTTCAAEHRVAKSGLEFVKLLIIDLTMAALVKIHPESAPHGNLLTATFVALEHFPKSLTDERRMRCGWYPFAGA